MKKSPSQPKLKKLYVVRHAEFFGEKFTRSGETQVNYLAQQLKMLIGDKKRSLIIITSPLERAVKTAEVVANVFGVCPQVYEALKADEYRDGQVLADGLVALSGDAEVLVVIGHHTAPSGIANAFAKKFEKTVVERVTRNGNGYFLDLVRKVVIADIFDPELG
jgi:phosphohistidine phosphatase SixA